MKFLNILTAALFLMPTLSAQEWSVKHIPAHLQDNVNLVLRKNTIQIKYISEKKFQYTITEIKTIMNEKESQELNFYTSQDEFDALKSFEGEIYNKDGILIRKIKKGDLVYWGFSTHLACKGGTYMYEYNTSDYPVTVKYVYTKQGDKGVLGFPYYVPLDRPEMSVQKSSYEIVAAEGLAIKYKTNGIAGEPVVESVKDGKKYTWVMDSLKSAADEIYSEPFNALENSVRVSPVTLVVEDTKGDLTDWKTFGDWQLKLMEGRQELPDALKKKLDEMTRNATSSWEKINIVYNYLRETTRYVSIQLGVGGWQPFPASQVYTTGFGDCKALTNYMHAMLSYVGINSYYTTIHTKRKRMAPDHAGFQSNHVILCVPCEKDTLWLECTAPALPLGYIHEKITGHDAHLITSEGKGSRLVTLPEYPDSTRKSSRTAYVEIKPDGGAQGNVSIQGNGSNYEKYMSWLSEPESEVADKIKQTICLHGVNLNQIHVTENRLPIPYIKTNFVMTALSYGRQGGNRLFIPINPFRTRTTVESEKERILPIVIRKGYIYSDTITIRLPEGMTVERIPSSTQITTPFGEFSSYIKKEGETIHIRQKFVFTSGKHPKEKIGEFIEFLNTVKKFYDQTMTVCLPR